MGVLDVLLGRPLATRDAPAESIGVIRGIPLLGLDALASSAYAPEAALTILIPLGAAGPAVLGPIFAVILVVLVVLAISYRQTIQAYPGGGGSYTVAKENLGERAGLLAAAALALDYVLNVAVAISAGVGALVSAVPALLPETSWLCLGVLALITIVNLRGVKDTGGWFLAPTCAFVALLAIVCGVGIVEAVAAGGAPTPVAPLPPVPPAITAVSAWLVVRAFSSGCTAMTGVEAVSNAVPCFRDPAPRTAQRTLAAIVVILIGLLGGVAYLCRAYGIAATEPGSAGFQSVLSMVTGAVVGRGVLYDATMIAVITVLALSANTSFSAFPRLCRLLARDRYLPDAFSDRGRRLVFSAGIVVLALLAGALLIAFGGVTDRLIPLFAVGAFLSFTLSQAGMVAHHRRAERGRRRTIGLAINGAGAIATGVTLIVIVASKLAAGAWITVIAIPALVIGFRRIRRHYDELERALALEGTLAMAERRPPIAILPADTWNRVTQRGLELALRLADEVFVVQIVPEPGLAADLPADWSRVIAMPPAARADVRVERVVLASPFRQFYTPFVDFVHGLEAAHPSRELVVIIPDLVTGSVREELAHNRHGRVLRLLLRARCSDRVVVIDAPYHLELPRDGRISPSPARSLARRRPRRPP
jgi:amino acid transporter